MNILFIGGTGGFIGTRAVRRLAATDERAARRIYNVGEEDAPTRAEWVSRIGRAAGWEGEVVAVPEGLLPEHLRSPTGYEHDLAVDTRRIRKELGYAEQVPRDEALLRTVRWEREHPPAETDPRQFDYAAEDAALERLSGERPLSLSRPHLTLIKLTEEWGPEFLAFAAEYLAAGEERYRPAFEDFQAYLRRLEAAERGLGLAEGRVPYSAFWLSDGRRLLGRATIRHRLTPELEQEGGHIGYDVRPSARGKGYGTLLLSLTLAEARGMGLRRVLLSCDTDNVRSAKVIERNRGRLASRAVSAASGKPISRYWIEL